MNGKKEKIIVDK